MKQPSKKPARASAKSLPNGQERMKRKPPIDRSLRPQKFEADPRKAYTVEQLAEIGAITLKWNQIEANLDFIGSHILFTKTPIWLILAADKVLSTKAKLTLLRECLKHSKLLDDRDKNCILTCFADVEQCRAYRNAIIHHHIYDHDKGIGFYIDESNSSYQILVSLEALAALYNVMCTLQMEMREIDLLFRIETDAQKPGFLDKQTRAFRPFDDDYLKAHIIPAHIERILVLQHDRRELYKLPQFPDADLVRSFNERTEDQPS